MFKADKIGIVSTNTPLQFLWFRLPCRLKDLVALELVMQPFLQITLSYIDGCLAMAVGKSWVSTVGQQQ